MSTFHAEPKRHAVKKRDHGVLAWTLALIAGALVFVPSYFYFSVAGAFEQVVAYDATPLLGPDRPAPPPPPTDAVNGQWINILVMGSDTRAGPNSAIGGENGAETEMNNDTTILMHISADRTRIELVSFPRDTMVQLPGCEYSDGSKPTGRERAMFNKAFYIGGMSGNVGDAAACTIKTVESVTGIYISEYIVIDFIGVQTIIDLLGGVPMSIPFSFTSTMTGFHFEAGPQVLSGAQALAWARTRHFKLDDPADLAAWSKLYGGGDGMDVPRIKRQQELVGKVFEVAVEENLFMHPAQLTSLLEAAAGSMTVSPNMKEVDFLLGLAWSIKYIDKANIVFTTVPTKGDPANPNRLVFVDAQADALFAAIEADQPIEGTSVAEMSTA